MSPWFIAARPKTLPLAISGILLGSAVAYLNHSFHLHTMLLGIATAVLLQILSNFANDYGDFTKGTDVIAARHDRMLASGKISKTQMLIAMFLVTFFTLISGISLLWFSNIGFSNKFIFFFILGILAIAAAIKYTVGKFAYAYSGMGDIFVLIFFGFVSVVGIFYLHAGQVHTEVILAAFGCGLLSVGVLNINNTRDIESDKKSGKITIPVRIGIGASLFYQRILCWLGATSIILSFFYHIQMDIDAVSPIEFILVLLVFSPTMILLAAHMGRMKTLAEKRIMPQDAESVSEDNTTEFRSAYNRELKTLSLSTLATVVIYWTLALLYV
jgi:1,4-dihydroxy-2-naphthoate octaprenyltransferase